jgi:hypothetical protein
MQNQRLQAMVAELLGRNQELRLALKEVVETGKNLQLRVQAGSSPACGVRAEHCGSGTAAGHRRADAVELDAGAQVWQAGGQRSWFHIDCRAD